MEKKTRKPILPFLLAGLAAVLILLASIFLIPNLRKSDPEESTASEAPPVTLPSFDEDAPLSAKISDAEYTIRDSYYETAEGYTYEDLYTILLVVETTTPLEEGDRAVFKLLRVPESAAPLLFTGIERADGHTDVTVYVFGSGRCYRLLATGDPICYDPASGLLYLPETDEVLSYSPHILKSYRGAENGITETDFERIVYRTFENGQISVSELPDYIEGGAADEK